MKCRACNTSNPEVVLDLGTQYVSGFYDEVRTDIPKAHMALVMCHKCALVQLIETPDQHALYDEYWYRSGTNESMIVALSDVVRTAKKWLLPLEYGDVVLDIACNDGTLLAMFDDRLVRIGIDPSDVAKQAGIQNLRSALPYILVNDFFSEDAYREVSLGRQAKLITSVAMFYDLPDPVGFARDVYACLDDDGIWVMQLSYTPLMLEQNAFDNICAEHLEYYTLASLRPIVEEAGFQIVDVTLNDTNGGSCCVVMAKEFNELTHVPMFMRQIGEYRIQSYGLLEAANGYNDPDAWKTFAGDIEDEKALLLDSIDNWIADGKTVYGYGASTKGNTLLQYYGLGPDRITAIAEKQPQKFGKLTAGSWIPIISEEELRQAKPDYVIVFPWHFKSNFLEREKELRASGTKFVFPLPLFEVVE